MLVALSDGLAEPFGTTKLSCFLRSDLDFRSCAAGGRGEFSVTILPYSYLFSYSVDSRLAMETLNAESRRTQL